MISYRRFLEIGSLRAISLFLAGLFLLLGFTPTSALAAGKIKHFTDSRGVVHITSDDHKPSGPSPEPRIKSEAPDAESHYPGAGPEAGRAATPPPTAVSGLTSGPETEPLRPAPATAVQRPPGEAPQLFQIHSGDRGKVRLQKLSPQAAVSSPPEISPGLLATRGGPPSGRQGGEIYAFKDRRGYLHITNLKPAGKPADRTAENPPLSPPAPPSRPPGFRPVSWQPNGPKPPAAPVPAGTTDLIVPRQPMIHRFRDNRGYWHITNVMPPGQGVPTGPSAVGSGQNQALAGLMQVPPGSTLLRVAGLADSRPAAGRLSIKSILDRQGIRHICNGPAAELSRIFPGPLAFLGKLQDDLGPIIAEATQSYRLPAALVLAVIKMESNFVPWAVSPKGAMGLMQLMPGTATDLGVRDPFNPRENIYAGCRHLRFLLDQFQGSLPLAVAAYNAGHQRVIAAGYAVPPIKETQDFVSGVMGLYYLMEKAGQQL